MPGKFDWLAETAGLFCGSFATNGGRKRYMVVESLPDGGWDWVAWAADGSGQCLHGRTATPGHAMQAAEHGAELLNAAPIIDLEEHRTSPLRRRRVLTN